MFDYQAISESCVKCGKCIPECTIYRIHPDETTSPRGFIDLLGAYQRGALELDKNAKDIFESCFLCTHCVQVCPNALPTDQVIESVRHEIAKKFGIAWYKRFYFFLLKNRPLMDWGFALGSVFTFFLFKKIHKGQAIKPRFPLPLIGKRVFMPLRFKSFMESYPEEIKNQRAASPRRVAIFIGCMANYHYTSIGDSLVEILEELQVDVLIPKKQQCCGAPAYFTGDFETVDLLIKRNVVYFETFIDEVEAILVPEATCAAMILKDWSHFMEREPAWRGRIEKLLPKIFMATDWLYKKSDLMSHLEKLNLQMKGSVTYHDPCHARKVLGIFKEPRALLSVNYSLKEMSNPNQCCGFGGVTLQTEKYAYAKKAGISKVQMIEESGAQIVSAECSACRMQLNNVLEYQGSRMTFAHPLELIADALRERGGFRISKSIGE